MVQQFNNAGPDARDVFVLNMLPELVERITETVANIDIDKITVIDSGGNGHGAVGSVAGQMPAAVISVVEQIENATGINILEALVRRDVDQAELPEVTDVASEEATEAWSPPEVTNSHDG